MKLSTFSFVLCSVLSLSHAIIYSRGSLTAQLARENFTGMDYRIRPGTGSSLVNSVSRARVTDVDKFPVLGLADVQFFIVTIVLDAGTSYPLHTHPRSSELIIINSGTATAMFYDEAGNTFTAMMSTKEKDMYVIPMGLIHTFKCTSRHDCRFTLVLNSADGGALFLNTIPGVKQLV